MFIYFVKILNSKINDSYDELNKGSLKLLSIKLLKNCLE